MRNRLMLVLGGIVLAVTGYVCGSRNTAVAFASQSQPSQTEPGQTQQGYAGAAPGEIRQPTEGEVPKTYGHVAAAIADQIGTGLVFEDKDGTIRFVSMNGMMEGKLERYDQTPTHGGIPKSYGHLIAAVVNGNNTGLVFEDSAGVIRFCTITGKVEGTLKRF